MLLTFGAIDQLSSAVKGDATWNRFLQKFNNVSHSRKVR